MIWMVIQQSCFLNTYAKTHKTLYLKGWILLDTSINLALKNIHMPFIQYKFSSLENIKKAFRKI